uniref:RGS domain-containing protein n=1 Tax=Scylla olivacea TaxID=85551 RepID=A0A0P4VVN1_SCYOL
MSSPTKHAAQPAPQATATPATKTEKEKEKAKQEKKKVLTKPQGEKWSSSINALLADPEGVEAFRDFLVELENESGEAGEYTRYIDFYLECEEYKARFKKLEDKAKEIFEDYLAEAAHQSVLLQVGADKEVGTGGKSVEIGDKLEDEGLEGVNLFDEPQKKVKKKLADGVYINFCLDIKKKLKL